jgi:hypothetical protein
MAKSPACSRFLDNFDELIQRLPSTLMKSHIFVFLARFFVTVENERRVLCSISLGLKPNEHGKEECNAGHRLRRFAWPVAGREGIGPNELFVLDGGSSPDFVDTVVPQTAIVSYWTGDRYPNDE